MRNAMIALYVITVYLGFGVNLVGASINCQGVQQCFAPTDNYDIEMTALLYLIRRTYNLYYCLSHVVLFYTILIT